MLSKKAILSKCVLLHPTLCVNVQCVFSSIKFARLGVTIAEAVISSVLPYYSAWNGDYKLLSPYHLTVNESHAAIDSSKQCLKEFIGTHRLATVDVSDATILSTLKYLSAISVAYEVNVYILILVKKFE